MGIGDLLKFWVLEIECPCHEMWAMLKGTFGGFMGENDAFVYAREFKRERKRGLEISYVSLCSWDVTETKVARCEGSREDSVKIMKGFSSTVYLSI